jgi:hypothetical protein
MGQKQDQLISCPVCGSTNKQGDLEKVCSNCFACTGCEIYFCPQCREEMVVKPVGEPRKRRILPEDIV